MKKNIIVAIVALIVGVVLGLAARSVMSPTVMGVSSSGVTNSSAKLASVTMAPTTAAASSTAILNSDEVDRAIIDSFAYCTGVGTSKTYSTGAGLAGWTAQMSTSTASADAKTNTNYVANLTLATSSAWLYVASTTEPVNTYSGRIWPTATYLNITFNATNTAACTMGVHYIVL